MIFPCVSPICEKRNNVRSQTQSLRLKTGVTRPNFFVFENNSKGVILALPFEAHTIQVIITKKGFLNRFKLEQITPADLKTWAQRNVVPLSQIAWFAYDHGRFRERMVATNLVRELEIDIDKYAGWAFS
jgi:hypothetical protein